jgi:hypothetical protein
VAGASLGFLGLEVPPPTPAWGSMLSGATQSFLFRAPWMAISPRPGHQPGRLPAISLTPSSGVADPQWQIEGERRAGSQLALHPDPAAVQLDELPAQGQPQSGALDFLCRRSHLPELLEHRLLIFRRDADPGVADGDLDQPVLGLGRDFDPTAFRRENLIAFDKRFRTTCLTFRSSALIWPSRESSAVCKVMLRRPARSRTSIRALSMAAGRSKSLSSSSIRPASILERSRPTPRDVC